MNSIEQFVIAMMGELMPWLTLWVICKYFLLHGKQRVEGESRLLATLDDLTACLVAMKNPVAAQQVANMKAVRQPDIDHDLVSPPAEEEIDYA